MFVLEEPVDPRSWRAVSTTHERSVHLALGVSEMTAPLEYIGELRALFAKLASERQDYDFQPPPMISHAKDYADDQQRLRKYAKQVICGRIMIFLTFSRMNTQRLLETFLLGVDSENSFPMLLAARSQLELLAVVADTARIIRENSGEQADRFVERVTAVDEALINATFGTRSSIVKEQMKVFGLSRLREATDKEYEALTSRNVLTRLERLSKSGVYVECKDDYERLCEYVHPNYGMNMLHVVPSPVHEKLLRFSLTAPDPHERAITSSAGVMARAAHGTVGVMDQLQPPFGEGVVTYFPK
jgi:hypothetical protein